MTSSLGPASLRCPGGLGAPRRLPGRTLRPSVLGAALLLATTAGSALSHEYWLAPSSYTAKARQPIEFGAASGTGFRGEPKLFSATRCVRFEGRGDGKLDFILSARDGDAAWARFAPKDDGGLMVGYESNFALIELAAAEFDAYLEAEGLSGPLETRRRAGTPVPGRERYRRCAKTWVAGDAPRRAVKPMGLPLEIVPLSAPGAGQTLKVRVEYHGKPLPDALVKGWRTPLADSGDPVGVAARDSVPSIWQERTDRRGEVSVQLDGAGEWLLSVVHMAASRDSAAADWESTWASLTFARFGERRPAPVTGEVHAGESRTQAR